MKMMTRILAAALVLVGLAACASPKYVVSDVTRYHNLPTSASGKTFAVYAVSDEQKESLAFQDYADLINARLSSLGLRQVEGSGTPDYAVTLEYDIDGPTPDVRSRTTNFSMGFGHWGRGWGWSGMYDPWPDTYTETRRVYTRRVELSLYEGASFDTDRKVKVFEGRALSEGLNGQIDPVLPYIIDALFENFPGASGQTQTVRVQIPADAVAAAKPNAPRSRSTY